MGAGIERPAVTGFHHVSAVVTDVESSATWYQRVLGLQRLPMTFPHHGIGGSRYPVPDDEKAALLLDSATGVMIELHAPTGGDGGPDRGALDHLAFGVASRDTLDSWAAWLDTLSVPHEGVVDRTDPTDYATLEFRDPDGIALEFIYFPGRG
ncbi:MULTISPECIES: VOC family protein [Pseudonocardia]|uniref:Glyoxalase/Bleomycin resistance protein/Dioxygenase superfamily protein n=2 Tax=Pseudonocardia TaxID=1847 RepID=A0A1Y2MSG4_PSEAH|nr:MULTISPECIES: VOC family protein [Pseudonocardia]OSY38160.1 Glyoxalase/Bleomycin resistance protein/Dioxygenase superfamily protein [Pseudonocardia autotrophica]TDN75600.1 catechol 2,3-dioxygenase-like lactoylglutathione lyase family enzyme [Pseudonocardia autotrophica]BBF99571.1 glyoxalase [Pseudonocardia autotrophica]GEC27810.1 glyoxalase [Pseudonocardia saturnea]